MSGLFLNTNCGFLFTGNEQLLSHVGENEKNLQRCRGLAKSPPTTWHRLAAPSGQASRKEMYPG